MLQLLLTLWVFAWLFVCVRECVYMIVCMCVYSMVDQRTMLTFKTKFGASTYRQSQVQISPPPVPPIPFFPGVKMRQADFA